MQELGDHHTTPSSLYFHSFLERWEDHDMPDLTNIHLSGSLCHRQHLSARVVSRLCPLPRKFCLLLLTEGWSPGQWRQSGPQY